MKKAPLFVASVLALAGVLYVGGHYFLPSHAPSPGLVGLLAAIAMAVVGAVAIGSRKIRASRRHMLVTAMLPGLLTCLLGCVDSNQSPITGTAPLLAAYGEIPGYKLYSYALLSHKPSESEVPKYREFIRALIALPSNQVDHYTPKKRINITYIPVGTARYRDAQMTVDMEVSYILDGYDYDRSAAMLAMLPTKIGSGPAIVSVLKPIDLNHPSNRPHPVLIQDLSLAQPSLMSSYVNQFVEQAGRENAWNETVLSGFALKLRSSLEASGVALGMSKIAVEDWIKYFN